MHIKQSQVHPRKAATKDTWPTVTPKCDIQFDKIWDVRSQMSLNDAASMRACADLAPDLVPGSANLFQEISTKGGQMIAEQLGSPECCVRATDALFGGSIFDVSGGAALAH